jgi:hypothetical protein
LGPHVVEHATAGRKGDEEGETDDAVHCAF